MPIDYTCLDRENDSLIVVTLKEHGVVFSPMYAWHGQFTDETMQDVVAHIRFLSQQAR